MTREIISFCLDNFEKDNPWFSRDMLEGKENPPIQSAGLLGGCMAYGDWIITPVGPLKIIEQPGDFALSHVFKAKHPIVRALRSCGINIRGDTKILENGFNNPELVSKLVREKLYTPSNNLSR